MFAGRFWFGVTGFHAAPHFPATTGNYTFWIAADDTAKLWLNPTGEAPASKVEIAFVPYSTGSRVWNAISEQRSAAYALQHRGPQKLAIMFCIHGL